MAQYSDWEIVHRLEHDNSPPFYYVLLGYWIEVFGDSPIGLRSLSVVCGLAAIVGMFLFTRALLTGWLADQRRISRREVIWTPLLTATLVALSPLQIRYSWEARMYALGTALAAFSAWGLVRALDSERPYWGRWALFAAITTLFAYTHSFALLTIAAEALFVAWWVCERAGGSLRQVVREPVVLPALFGFGLVALGFSFWVPTMLQQVKAVHSSFWIPPLLSYTQLYPICHQLFVDPIHIPPAQGASAVFTIRTAAAVALLVFVTARRARWADGLVLTLGLVPILLTVLLCLCGIQVFLVRYLIFAQLFLLAALALTLTHIRHPALFAFTAVSVVTVSFYWYVDGWQAMDVDQHPGFRGAAEYISERRQPGDLVLTCNGMSYFPILYHLRDRERVFALAREQGWVEGDWVLSKNQIVSQSQISRWAGCRVWVVNLAEGKSGQPVVPVPISWRETDRESFPEVSEMETAIVIQYTLPAASQIHSGDSHYE
jgi:uncharacterized membrane protein